VRARNRQHPASPRRVRRVILAAAITALTAALAATAVADHSWGNSSGAYHWARTASQLTQGQFNLNLVDSVDLSWSAYLGTTSSDWSGSTVLDTTIVAGADDTKTRRRCPAVTGQVRVCNYAYGNNGWLGVASVWLSGQHIVRATTKMNDTYYKSATYNTPVWRNHVMCQEVGHTLGLDHQSENGDSLGTCMDYAMDPTASQHPNLHDYQQLETIYGHSDTTSTIASTSAAAAGSAGLSRVRDDVWVEHLGGGRRIVHFVYWASQGPHRAPDLH